MIKKAQTTARDRLVGKTLIGVTTEAGAVRKPAIKAINAEIKPTA